MDIFKLYRFFWDFCFEHPEKIKPNDIAIYSFAIEHCNRLGWKRKFGFPTSMVLEAVGIKSYSVYKKHFDNLVDLGFFEVVEYSKNQYSANVIALKENYKANTKAGNKALDKAFIKHATKQSESTSESIVSINKQETIEQKTTNLQSLYFDKIKIDEIYNLYPKKAGKKAGYDKLSKLKYSDDLFNKIKKHIAIYKKEDREINFYKDFSAYVNQQLWEDITEGQDCDGNIELSLEEKLTKLKELESK